MRRSERGAQSSSRSASSIAPCTRRRAKASNGHAERRLVAVGGVDQAEHADADQVVHLDLRRQALRQPVRHRLDQADVVDHELVAVGLAASARAAARPRAALLPDDPADSACPPTTAVPRSCREPLRAFRSETCPASAAPLAAFEVLRHPLSRPQVRQRADRARQQPQERRHRVGLRRAVVSTTRPGARRRRHRAAAPPAATDEPAGSTRCVRTPGSDDSRSAHFEARASPMASGRRCRRASGCASRPATARSRPASAPRRTGCR